MGGTSSTHGMMGSSYTLLESLTENRSFGTPRHRSEVNGCEGVDWIKVDQ